MKTLDVQYYAIFREQRGQSDEQLQTTADTAEILYQELAERHNFSMPQASLKVVVNEEFCDWDCPLNDGDTVVFIPPVAGG
jgi:molybdopterin synthase sulfur carrier subunit